MCGVCACACECVCVYVCVCESGSWFVSSLLVDRACCATPLIILISVFMFAPITAPRLPHSLLSVSVSLLFIRSDSFLAIVSSLLFLTPHLFHLLFLFLSLNFSSLSFCFLSTCLNCFYLSLFHYISLYPQYPLYFSFSLSLPCQPFLSTPPPTPTHSTLQHIHTVSE